MLDPQKGKKTSFTSKKLFLLSYFFTRHGSFKKWRLFPSLKYESYCGWASLLCITPPKRYYHKKKESDSTNIVQQRFVGPKRPFNGELLEVYGPGRPFGGQVGAFSSWTQANPRVVLWGWDVVPVEVITGFYHVVLLEGSGRGTCCRGAPEHQ